MGTHQILPLLTSALRQNFTVVDICTTWRRVEMRNINIGQQWILAHVTTNPAIRAVVLASIQQVLLEMHNVGFVHGDARAGNVENRIDENENMYVMLIDFDSAGNAGTARYNALPFSISYTPGAEPGGLVTAEHDNWRAETIDRFFA